MIDSQSLSESDGHQVSWTYTWNSADVSGVAADDRQVRFVAYDFAARSDLDSETVDVVPYITGIARTVGTNRSKYGRFAVQEGETGIVLSGYNLAQTGTSWVRVYNTKTGGSVYDDVAITASGSPYTSMTVSLACSDALRVAAPGGQRGGGDQQRKRGPRHQQGGRRQRPRLHPLERRPLPAGLVRRGGSFTGKQRDPEHPSAWAFWRTGRSTAPGPTMPPPAAFTPRPRLGPPFTTNTTLRCTPIWSSTPPTA